MAGILFVTATRIGDAVLSTGVLDHVLDRHPGASVTVACGPAAAALFRRVPGLERVIPLAKRRLSGHWLALWRRVAGRHWDAVVDLRGSALAWTLAARARHVLVRSRDDAARHRVQAIAAALGIDPPRPPRLWLGPDDRAEAARLLPGGQPVLALGPSANWTAKEWPAERFAALALALTAQGGPLAGARIAVFGGAGERGRIVPVLDALPAGRRVDLVGRDLLVVGACLERAALHVGNDTGLTHVAAAAGAPTLALFGPTDERRYAPWGPRAAVIRTAETARDLVGTPGFDHRTSGSLMGGLAVDTVVAAATRLLARTGTGR